MRAAVELSETVGKVRACDALGIPRASFYRWKNPTSPEEPRKERLRSPRALSLQEREEVLSTLHVERFVDKAPAEVYATLLDEGHYLCSVSTMYLILAVEDEVRERRNQLRHPAYTKPELLATGPNEVWSWDITKLLGPQKWTYYYLYVILDIFSRYVVSWLLAERESTELAKRLIREAVRKQGIDEGELTIHSDRGPSMGSRLVAQLLADLGVTKSHSRPHVSNDNPYSEAHFKRLKYRPGFPERFGSQEDAKAFSRDFFGWYNDDHRHSGIGFMTPATVHCGRDAEVYRRRQEVLRKVYEKNPERFVGKPPKPPRLPEAAWINPPAREEQEAVVGSARKGGGRREALVGGNCAGGTEAGSPDQEEQRERSELLFSSSEANLEAGDIRREPGEYGPKRSCALQGGPRGSSVSDDLDVIRPETSRSGARG